MTRAVLAFILVFLSAQAAQAGLSRAALDAVKAAPPPGARLDLSLSARDENGKLRSLKTILDGRPAFVNFLDYTCNTLCGTDLMLLADGIRRAGLRPANFRILLFGIDPKDSAQEAIKMERAEIPAALLPATVVLLPDQRTITSATAAMGFHYVHDTAIDQFAHPAIVYAVGPDGKLRGVLSPMNLLASDLKAVMRAPLPTPSGLYQRIRLLCYAYDPVTGRYTARVDVLLKIAAGLTVLLLAAFTFLLGRRAR